MPPIPPIRKEVRCCSKLGHMPRAYTGRPHNTADATNSETRPRIEEWIGETSTLLKMARNSRNLRWFEHVDMRK